MNLQDALRELTAISGVSMQPITRCCIGTAGKTVPLIVDWLREAFARNVGCELIIVGDIEVALNAAFFGKRGVLVLAGTGSNVAGRAVNGNIVTACGWARLLPIKAPGTLLVEGLRCGFLAHDEQRPTRVLDIALAHWKLDSFDALVEYANARPTPDYSQLAPLFVAGAEQGDVVAQEVLAQCSADLAYLTGIVIEHMRNLEENFKLPLNAIAGSILEHVEPVRRAMQGTLSKQYPGIEFLDSPAGALWDARNGIVTTLVTA